MQKYEKPSDDVLRQTLTPLQYEVTQHNATERPFENEYDQHFEEGIYIDIVSEEPLFLSCDKCNSGCGWPAFSKPINRSMIKEKADWSHQMHRIEVRSAHADSHLGMCLMMVRSIKGDYVIASILRPFDLFQKKKWKKRDMVTIYLY